MLAQSIAKHLFKIITTINYNNLKHSSKCWCDYSNQIKLAMRRSEVPLDF